MSGLQSDSGCGSTESGSQTRWILITVRVICVCVCVCHRLWSESSQRSTDSVPTSSARWRCTLSIALSTTPPTGSATRRSPHFWTCWPNSTGCWPLGSCRIFSSGVLICLRQFRLGLSTAGGLEFAAWSRIEPNWYVSSGAGRRIVKLLLLLLPRRADFSSDPARRHRLSSQRRTGACSRHSSLLASCNKLRRMMMMADWGNWSDVSARLTLMQQVLKTSGISGNDHLVNNHMDAASCTIVGIARVLGRKKTIRLISAKSHRG